MNFEAKYILKIKDFFRRYGLIVVIAIILVLAILGVNYALKNNNISKKTTVDDFVQQSVDTVNPIPDGYKDKIEKVIDDFITSCNKKEYEIAYNMLEDEFKSIYFKDISKFKTYIDKVFVKEKMYNIQNSYNVNNFYIFDVRIMDNYLSTGTTDDYKYLVDQYVLKNINGEFKICLNGYCSQQIIDKVVEDDFMKINIVNKITTYDSVKYTVKVTNKTKNYIVLANEDSTGEFVLNVSGDMKISDTSDSNIIILPNEASTKIISFDKNLSNQNEDTEIIFNAIRILPKYSGKTENLETEMQNAVKKYSLKIDLNGED